MIDTSKTGDKEDQIDEQRRKFLLTATGIAGGVGLACALTPFVSSWFPTNTARAAGGPIQVDLSSLKPGQQLIVAWRGKPIWIIRRTQAMLGQLVNIEDQLRDPNSLVDQQPAYAKNRYRSINPEYLVLVGVCTHLGCSPQYKPGKKECGADWIGGFFCPCHGSTFDLAGRVFKGKPAPINLEVPPYRFISEQVIMIGEEA